MKTIDDFRQSLSGDAPPAGVVPALQALWWLGKGNWDQAHKVCQGHEDNDDCNWVHAHLHRQEGDLRNAGGWYSRAGRPASTTPLKEEWETIARALLG